MYRSSDCPLLNGYFVKNITSIRIKRFVKKTKLQWHVLIAQGLINKQGLNMDKRRIYYTHVLTTFL